MKKNPRYEYLIKDLLSEQLEQYEFNIIMFQYFIQNKNSYVKNEILGHYKVVVLKKGSCKIVYNNKDYYLTQPGTIFFLSPFTIFDAYCTSTEPVEFYHIHFSVFSKATSSKFLHMINNPFLIATPPNIDSLMNYLEFTYQGIAKELPGSYFISKSFVMHLVTFVINSINEEYKDIYRKNSSTACKQELVLTCLNYIDAHMEQNISITDLCKLTNVSQSYLYQCFFSTFQCSTKEYVTKYKLRRIEKFLLQSDLSIEQIALQFGYPTVYAFSTLFKKHYLVSPSQYRKIHVKK